MTAAQTSLVEQHHDLVAVVARREARKRRQDRSDVESVCRWALVHAALTWPGGGSFRAWAARVMQRKLVDDFRTRHPRLFGPWRDGRSAIGYVPVRFVPVDHRVLVAPEPAPEHAADPAWLDRLAPIDAQTLRASVLGGQSLRDIAHAEGISKAAVRSRLARAKRHARQLLEAA